MLAGVVDKKMLVLAGVDTILSGFVTSVTVEELLVLASKGPGSTA